MKISDVVRGKAGDVITISGDATVTQLLDLLASHKIGAVVVSNSPGAVDGIVSERDIMYKLASGGADALWHPVSEIMTTEVTTCSPSTELGDVAQTMTDHRIRHLPIVEDDKLVGIVSIGDVVKSRIEILQAERDQLVGYIQQQ